MSVDEEDFKMSRAGLVARSAEGHAAKGMRIKDQDDMWVEIQHHTFKNWVNVQLRETGLKVEDLSEDLRDGLALVTVVEVLQKRRLRKVKRVLNQHQALENVTTALNAISDDGIKLVNIGNVDIVNGNLKLILGLIWSLIMHYQIGQSKFPPKKLMLAWLKAVLPDCRVHNFTSDWNSGVYLSALLEYCRPGLYSNWKNLNPRNAVDNCKNAMEIAKAEFNIPMLLEPEILASPYLDDLSGMTYLSYFMKEGGPGYKATLEWVRKQLPDKNVKNFTTDWNDGMHLTTLVKQLGGPVPGYKKLTPAPRNWESNLQIGIDGGKRLGVEPILAASDMARPDVEYLGNMGYIAYYQWVRPRECPSDTIAINCNLDNVRVNNPVPFEIEFLSKEVVLSELRVEVRGPSGPVRVDLDLGPRGGKGVFIPDQVGIYELNVFNEEELVDGCPVKVRALPDVAKVMFSGIDPCAIGSIVEVVVNSNGAGSADIEVTAYSPTNRPLSCPVKVEDGVYAAVFQPDEAGEWSIAVTYDDEHIQGSPFTCHVYDPNALKLEDLDHGPSSSPGHPFTFVVDARGCGYGDAKVDVTQGGRSIPSKSLEIERGLYEVTFTPVEAAKHKIYAYFSGHEVKGSPFPLYLGVEKPPDRKDSKAKKKKSSSRENKDPKEVKEIVKEYSSSALVNHSPRLSLGSLDTSHNKSSLNKIYDSAVNESYESSVNKSYKSAVNKSYDTVDDTSYEPVLSPSNRLYDSSVAKSSSTYENINNKYANFESSSIVNRTSVLDSSSKKISTGTYESMPPKPVYNSTPKKISTYESSPSSPSKPEFRSSALDTSHNSSFNSTFNTSTATVINTGVTSKSTSIFNKSSSPGRLSSPGPRISASPSPPPPSRAIRAMSPLESSRVSPIRATSPPSDIPGLSSPSKVLQITQNAAKTSEARRQRNIQSLSKLRSRTMINNRDENSDTGGLPEDSPTNPHLSSEQRSALLQSDERLTSMANFNSASNVASTSSSSSVTSTAIRRMEENLQTSGANRRVTSSIIHPVSISSVETTEEKRGGVRSGATKTEYIVHGSKSDLRSDHGITFSEDRHHYNTKDHLQKLETTEEKRGGVRSGVTKTEYVVHGSKSDLRSDHGLTSSEDYHQYNVKDHLQKLETTEEKRGGVRSGATKTEYIVHGSKSDLRGDHGLTSSEDYHQYNVKDHLQKLETTEEKRGGVRSGATKTEYIVHGSKSDLRSDHGLTSSEDYHHYNLKDHLQKLETTEEKRGGVRSGVTKTEYSIHGSKSDDLRSDHGVTSSEDHHLYNAKDHLQKLETTTYLSSSTTSVDVTDAVSHRLQGSSPHHQQSIHLSQQATQQQIDASRVSVSGPGVRLVSVSSQAEFTVSMPQPLRQEEVNVHITGPGKRQVAVETQTTADGEVMAAFTPLQVGEYVVDVRIGDSRVPGSPFRCYVFNAQEIQVGAIPNGIVGRPVEFEIDGSSAGSGNLEILVNGGHVTSYVRNLGQQRFLASFVPHSAIRHAVEMRFNGEKVPGSPWSVEVMEGSGARVAVLGDTIKHFPAGQLSAFDISAANVSKEDIQVHIVSPAKRPVSYQLTESGEDVYRVAFVTTEVGSYIVDVAVAGQKVQGSPFIAKAYDAGLIRVSDVPNGVVGQPCQFRVDASQAGEGQLEISINDGEVPNHVQVLGGGRCLVSFTPDTAKLHTIDIKFNGETVRGCPFVCRVADTSRVSLTLRHLELIPVGQPAAFNIAVDGGGSAELTVTVRTPSHTTLPVRVSGSVRAGFTAEFTPVEVGAHTIIVNYNDSAVSGTPFTCKVYDASKVGVSHLPRGAIGKSLQFVVDASEGGEGNLEISISAAGRNIPTQVHPQGSARFAVSFVPLEAIDHIINISFNKEPVQGSPFVAKVQADPNRIVVSGQSLAATAVGKTSFFTISNVTGSVEDVEVSVEGRSRKHQRAY